MKKIFLVGVLIVSLLLTACGPASIKKAEKLADAEKYGEAIEVYETLIDKSELNFEAWFGILDAQMDDDEYEDAADTLEDLFDVIDDNYDLDDEKIDYEDVLDDFKDYCDEVLEEEELGDWYYDLEPVSPDLSAFDYNTYEKDAILELDITKDSKIYFEFDDANVTDKSTLYKEEDGITLTQDGSFYIYAMAINKFGFESAVSSAYVTVASIPDAPIIDTASGTYPSPLIIYLDASLTDGQDILYTTDGSDPENGYYYYPEDGITLSGGEYELRAIVYDYNSSYISAEATASYVVEKSLAPTVNITEGTYDGPIILEFTGFDPASMNVYYTTDGSDPYYGYLYYPEDGVELTTGEYSLRAIIYDNNTWESSEELVQHYTIK